MKREKFVRFKKKNEMQVFVIKRLVENHKT